MQSAADIFGRDKALIGMVHLAALPGTPGSTLEVPQVVEQAVREATLLAEAGFDAILIENMNDVPYLQREVGPEIIAAMTIVACAIRRAVELPLGVQVLAGANTAAMAVAHAAQAEFVRVEGFVFSAVADEGLLEKADAGPLLRYRKQIGAERVRILADIKKKHSAHSLTADVDVGEMAKAAEFFGADGVIITGIATGQAIRIDDLGTARIATNLPLLVGSGITPDSVANIFAYADAVIVGSYFKKDGLWSNAACPDRARELVEAVKTARIG